ncbi:hypothetical protein B0T25DRAFT_103036 [Lasiosphaeria hispida]|uniref:Uncharacterized protein n=1 Tax=Lasiosphaeria hispida TaxID=260671 RepID=A0AAJ0MI26_9PEZI|nr:hypothetical protein B0T25DRAFT_103036 [Lasiosphaeria hispida]
MKGGQCLEGNIAASSYLVAVPSPPIASANFSCIQYQYPRAAHDIASHHYHATCVLALSLCRIRTLFSLAARKLPRITATRTNFGAMAEAQRPRYPWRHPILEGTLGRLPTTKYQALRPPPRLLADGYGVLARDGPSPGILHGPICINLHRNSHNSGSHRIRNHHVMPGVPRRRMETACIPLHRLASSPFQSFPRWVPGRRPGLAGRS